MSLCVNVLKVTDVDKAFIPEFMPFLENKEPLSIYHSDMHKINDWIFLINLFFQITLHISYLHAIVNPTLFLVLHRGLRKAALEACCGWIPIWLGPPPVPTPPDPPRRTTVPEIACLKPPMPAHPDSAMVIKYYM